MAFNFMTKGAYRMAGGVILLAIGLTLAISATGSAQQSGGPHVWSTPTISGTQRVNSVLTGTFGQATGPQGTKYGVVWMRCTDTNPNLRNCQLLDNTNSSHYTLVAADQGRYMRVSQYAYTSQSLDYKASNPTNPIQAASSSPTPTPVPTPVTPAATPAPTPAPTFDVAAPVATPAPNTGAVLTPTQRKAKLLKPFPVIRIRGRLSTRGAMVTSLTVRAPHRVRITVTCGGPGCPTHHWSRTAARTHLARFERDLPGGLWLRVRITKHGYIGKMTMIRIRRGKVPLRTDGCVYPGKTKMQTCPAK